MRRVLYNYFYKFEFLIHTLATGILLGIGFVVPALWWFGIIGIIWLLYFLLEYTNNWKRILLFGFFTSWIKFAFSYSWVLSLYPLNWLPVSGIFIEYFFIGLYWFSSAFFSALSGLFLASIFFLCKKMNTSLLLMTIPFIWVVGEVLSSVIFSIFYIGPNSFINTNMSLAYVGYLLAEHNILFHVSALYGVYSLSLLFVFISVFFYLMQCKNKLFLHKTRVIVPLLLFVILTSFIKEPDLITGNSIDLNKKIVIVETEFLGRQGGRENIPINESKKILSALSEIDLSDVDFLLLPEGVGLLSGLYPGLLGTMQMREVLGDTEVFIIDSTKIHKTDNSSVLRGYLIDGRSMNYKMVDKQYLVPQGEYFPNLHASLLRVIGKSHMVDKIRGFLNIEPGRYHDQSSLGDGMPVILFCFEVVNPFGVHNLMRQKEDAPFVAHILSHAVMDSPHILWRQLDTMLLVHARWNRVPIVSSANRAISGLYLPDGTMQKSIEWEPLYEDVFLRLYEINI